MHRIVLHVLLLGVTLASTTCGKDSPSKPAPPAPPPSSPPSPPPPPASVPSEIRISTPSSLINLYALGQTYKLSARVLDQSDRLINDAQVSWSSSDTGVAEVSPQGLVTATGVGTATITARSGSASSSVEIRVAQVAASIVVEPLPIRLSVIGETIQLTANVLDSNRNPIAGTSVTWSISDTGTATISAQGLVTAVRNGTVRVIASFGSIKKEVTVVVSLTPSRIAIAPGDTTLTVLGEQVRYIATVYDTNDNMIPNPLVNWTSDNPGIASVSDSGVVTALHNGTAGITASSGDVSAIVVVSVLAPSKDSSDREILIALYNQTGGPDWIRSTNWLSEEPVVEWENVTADYQGRVTALFLGSNNLSGTIPVELSQLDHLEILWLWDNELSGPLPPELGGMASLERLGLSDNRLTGNIPREIMQPDNLWELDLANNQLTGPIPSEIGQVANLAAIYLSGNQLTGPIPPEMGQPTYLSTIYLSRNQLSGSLPPELGSLEYLDHLDLSDNPSLSGPLPREFLNLNPVTLHLGNTALCVPSDAEFYAWLQRIPGVQPVSVCESMNTDRDVLSVLYNELNGPDWTESENWLTDVPIGEWHGVETDTEGRVRSITLADNRLEGDIPSELGQLTDLETLDLSDNLLTGTLPIVLGRLTSLVDLQLQGNIGLTGPLPQSLTDLQNLERFMTYGTQLCAPRDAVFQAWLEGISARRVTNCEDLRIERIALDALYDRTQGLNWTSNEGWGSTDYVGSWYGVTTNEDGFVTGLNLSGNGLRGRLPNGLYLLKELTSLDLSDNPYLGGTPPVELTELDLDTLLLNGTQLCFAEGDGFQDWLSTIQNTDYETCGVVNPHPDVDALVAIYNATGGAEWRERGNWLSHSPIETWYGIVTDDQNRVTEINLFGLGLNGSIPPEIEELSELKRLHLGSNRLRGSIPAKISHLQDLETLILADNDLSGTIPREIGQLGNLTSLHLQGNMLTGTIPPEIGQLTNLEILRLDENDLEGSIPDEIGELTNLTLLFLRENGLTGHIPEEIGRLEDLTLLDLSVNLLTGNIPGELWRLDKLESMRLAINRLSGSVPSQIAQLTNLKEFDIRHNQEMSGRLPRQMLSLNLTHLVTLGTSICIPADAEFRTWLQGISYKELSAPCPF